MHRIDNNCFLITTGLSGDGNALAHASRLTCQRIRRENGDNNEDFDSTMPIREIANYISDMQHELTRTSGARPFGISATIIGVDKTSEELHLYQSEAGGTLEEYNFIASGKNRMLLQQKLHELWSIVSKMDDNEQLKETIILEMCNILFDHGKNVRCIDVWYMRKNVNSRNGMDIYCAKSVKKNQIKDLHVSF